MVTIFWASINHVAPAADMPWTLRHSYRVSGHNNGMTDIIVAAMFWFGLVNCCYFLLVCLVSFWIAYFSLLLTVFL